MAASSRHSGGRWNEGNSRYEIFVRGTLVAFFDDVTADLTLNNSNGISGAIIATSTALGLDDDVSLELGTGDDSVLRHRTGTLDGTTALTDVLIGTPVGQATAADSLLVSNITASGDMVFFVNNGGHSLEMLHLDGSAGTVKLGHGSAGITLSPTSGALTLDSVSAMVFQIGAVDILQMDDSAISSFAAENNVAGQAVFWETEDGGASPTSTGTAGGAFNFKTGDGVTAGGSGNDTGGAGGAVTHIAGAGATGGTTNGPGGVGGAFVITSGAGGTGAGSGAGGVGGAVTLTAGAGGVDGGTGTGGVGGAVSLIAGASPNSNTEAAGGDVLLTPGASSGSAAGNVLHGEVVIDDLRNLALGTGVSIATTRGDSAIYFDNTASQPTGATTGGGALYVRAHELEYMDDSGTLEAISTP